MVSDLSLQKLEEIFQSVIRRQENRVDPIRSKFGTIKKEEVSMEDKLEAVSTFAREHKKFSFRQLLKQQSSKTEVIVTFLSILELMKKGEIRIHQEKTFDDILIESMVAA